MTLSNDTTERKQQLKDMLATGIHEVTFTKVDGSVRVMPCTLMPTLLPALVVVENAPSKKVRVENPELISVWCTDKQEWRSFKVMNVTQITEVVGV